MQKPLHKSLHGYKSRPDGESFWLQIGEEEVLIQTIEGRIYVGGFPVFEQVAVRPQD